MFPHFASHSLWAFSSMASNTGVRSPGEELMTCNTSAVAVCCSLRQFGHIRDMNDPFAAQEPCRRRSWHRLERPSQQLRQRVGQAALCDGAEFPCVLGTAAQKPWISAAFRGLRKHRRAPKQYHPIVHLRNTLVHMIDTTR